MMPRLLPGEDQEVSRKIESIFKKKGIRINTGIDAKTLDLHQYNLTLVCVGRAADTATLGLGQIGVTLERGKVLVDEYLRTNIPNIYAAGDCAETRNIVTGQPEYVPLALKANKEGVVAGINIAGGQEAFPGVLGTAITKFGNHGLARTGLTLEESQKSGFDAFKFKVEANSRAHYYPGQGPMTFVIIADRKVGRLLGAQITGPADSVKRIDVYATAITANMNLDQIFHLDLAYAPPFSPVYDPVVLTGRVGRKMVSQ